MKTFIVIPAYNEGKTIGEIVRRCKKYGEVIVVDDGSKDDTSRKSKTAGATVIEHKINKGYGRTLYDGIKFAIRKKADYIITIDADGQHDPEDIPKFIERLESGCDVIVGSRFLGGRQWGSLKRMTALKLLALQVRVFSGLKLTDVQSGFRGYNSKVFEKIELTDFGMGLSVELPIKARKKGFSFSEVQIVIKRPKHLKGFFNVLKQGIEVGIAIIKYSLFS